jgi:hypothetical protein
MLQTKIRYVYRQLNKYILSMNLVESCVTVPRPINLNPYP